jgi:hypothetical protein
VFSENFIDSTESQDRDFSAYLRAFSLYLKDGNMAEQNIVQEKPASKAAPIYGKVTLKWPKYESVRDGFKAGTKSTAAIDYECPINGTGMTVKGAIYGTLTPGGEKDEIVFAASAPSTKAVDFEARNDRERLLAHVELAAVRSCEAAQSRLTGVKAAKTANTADVPVRPDMKPRLVKRQAETVTKAAETVQ